MAIKSLMISLVVSIQYTSVRDTGQQLVPCLDIASRGENRTDIRYLTRSSADADNRLDAFSGGSRSTNMVPFHM